MAIEVAAMNALELSGRRNATVQALTREIFLFSPLS
jgi:hypothetical protein